MKCYTDRESLTLPLGRRNHACVSSEPYSLYLWATRSSMIHFYQTLPARISKDNEMQSSEDLISRRLPHLRQDSQSSIGSKQVANSSTPRSLAVPDSNITRNRRPNSDLEAGTELETFRQRGSMMHRSSRHSTQENGAFDEGIENGVDPPQSAGDSKDDGDVYDDGASVRTQYTQLKRRDLSMVDVAALIINKMIGTGIFTTPGLVLNLTGNKNVSIALWLVGGVWSFLRYWVSISHSLP